MAWGERCPTPARMGAECGDRKASLTASLRPSAKRCGDVLGLSACVGPSAGTLRVCPRSPRLLCSGASALGGTDEGRCSLRLRLDVAGLRGVSQEPTGTHVNLHILSETRDSSKA